MEEKKLTIEEINGLEQQYFDMTEDLQSYRRLFRTRKFWKASKQAREQAIYQYRFFKQALNETLLSLIQCEEWYNKEVVGNALRNRFVKLRTKVALWNSIL